MRVCRVCITTKPLLTMFLPCWLPVCLVQKGLLVLAAGQNAVLQMPSAFLSAFLPLTCLDKIIPVSQPSPCNMLVPLKGKWLSRTSQAPLIGFALKTPRSRLQPRLNFQKTVPLESFALGEARHRHMRAQPVLESLVLAMAPRLLQLFPPGTGTQGR